MTFDPERLPPPHTDLDAANAELVKLRKIMLQERLRWANAVEKGELTKRSLTGTIRSLQNQLKLLKGMLP